MHANPMIIKAKSRFKEREWLVNKLQRDGFDY